jgi:3-oxoadipate enol-lactonase
VSAHRRAVARPDGQPLAAAIGVAMVGPMPIARINDIGIHYEVHGEGEPVVLIGGLGSDLTMFGGIIGRLAKSSRVLAFDNRGAGRTDKPDTPYSIEMMADDTIGLMEALRIPRADIVGISMGGSIGLELTLAHPDRVKGLVLVSASARKPAKVTLSAPMRVAYLLRSLPMFRGRYPQPEYAHERQREASRSYDCTERLGEIDAPTLILHGRRDRTVPYRLVEEMHDSVGSSKLVTFDGGHLFFLGRERSEFLERVAAFVG